MFNGNFDARQYTDCSDCQAKLTQFHADNPSVDPNEVILEEMCDACTADFDAWADSCYQDHMDAEFGRLAIESDAHDAEVRRC